MRGDIVHVSLTYVVALLLYQLPAVEDGQERHQQTPVLVVRHPATVVTLTLKRKGERENVSVFH
jgi:hypothetical protein